MPVLHTQKRSILSGRFSIPTKHREKSISPGSAQMFQTRSTSALVIPLTRHKSYFSALSIHVRSVERWRFVVGSWCLLTRSSHEWPFVREVFFLPTKKSTSLSSEDGSHIRYSRFSVRYILWPRHASDDECVETWRFVARTLCLQTIVTAGAHLLTGLTFYDIQQQHNTGTVCFSKVR